MNKDSTVTFVPAVYQNEPYSPLEIEKKDGIARSPSIISQTFQLDDKTLQQKRGSMPGLLFPNINSQTVTPSLIQDGGSQRPLSAHEQKEEEIYKTLAQMPSRNIEFVAQKTEEQKRMEKEFKYRATYDRLSLPSVYKRRSILSPHAKVTLSNAQKKMKLQKLETLEALSEVMNVQKPYENTTTQIDLMRLHDTVSNFNTSQQKFGGTLTQTQRSKVSLETEYEIPNFIDCIFLSNQSTKSKDATKLSQADEHIMMINQKQFQTVTKLFDDFYDSHEPTSIYDNIRELRNRLNRKKVLNVNVVEDEHAKIKKENMGKGALLNTSLRIDDPNMQMFTRELQNMLQLPNKEDKYMQYKIKLAKQKARQKKEALEKKLKEAVESDSEDVGPTYVSKLADQEVDKLQEHLETILEKRPSVKVGHARRTSLLKPPSFATLNASPQFDAPKLKTKRHK